jgi:hypothetical protein
MTQSALAGKTLTVSAPLQEPLEFQLASTEPLTIRVEMPAAIRPGSYTDMEPPASRPLTGP